MGVTPYSTEYDNLEESGKMEWLLGALTQLLVRYPTLVRDIEHTDLTVDIVFYIEDPAIDCSHLLLDAGITAIHRLDRPRVVSLQLPSILTQDQVQHVVQTIGMFLKGCVGS